MFLVLLVVSFVLATLTAAATWMLFAKPVDKLLGRLVQDFAPVWRKYIRYATYVVGISGGVRIWEIERYVTPDKDGHLLTLTADRWIIEIYKTLIGTLQSVAWMLLVFFLFALVAYVVVRGFESRRDPRSA